MNKYFPIETGRSFYSLSTRQADTLTHQQDNILSRTTQTLYSHNTLITMSAPLQSSLVSPLSDQLATVQGRGALSSLPLCHRGSSRAKRWGMNRYMCVFVRSIS